MPPEIHAPAAAPVAAPADVPVDAAGERRAARVVDHGWWGVVWFGLGALLGSHALEDNSFLTHLSTGRIFLADGAVHADPYSFTAAGRPWVVQSWLVSVLDAGAERVAGPWAIRVMVSVATGLLVAGIWRLTRRAPGLTARIVVCVAGAGLGAFWWNERPQVIAFALLAATLVVLDEDRSPWWLVPVFAVWTDAHGSFPVGVVLVVAWVVVRIASGERRDRAVLEPVATALLGCLLGALVSPYGTDQLTFPLRMVQRTDVLRYIVEWRRPALSDPSTWLFVAALLAVGVGVVRSRAWWWGAPVALMALLGAASSRNVALAAVVLVPIAARVVPGIGTLPSHAPARPGRVVVAGVVVAGVIAALMAPGADYAWDHYPVAAVDWMSQRHLVANREVHVVTHDYVGAYLEWRYGTRAQVFVDDRAEVFDAREIGDYVRLLGGTRRWPEILGSYDADVVLWDRHAPLAAALRASTQWRIAYADSGFVVACRRDAALAC